VQRLPKGWSTAGADVCLHYFQSDATPRKLAEQAKSKGQRALALQADLRQESEAKEVVKQATEFLGGLDVLINNAGSLVARRKLEEVDIEFWDEVIRINLTTIDVRYSRRAACARQGRGIEHRKHRFSRRPQGRAWRLLGLLECQRRSAHLDPGPRRRALVPWAFESTVWHPA